MTPQILRDYLTQVQAQGQFQADKNSSDLVGTVSVIKHGSFWRKFISYIGPGYLVAVGYMDPGNWATALAGGSQFGYTLLSICLISNIMAIILQSLCARLGIATGLDLAQACRAHYPRPVSFVLWVLAELAICATDLAEVIGTAIGLYLLFHIPLEWGVLITGLDVFLVLALQRLGFRWIEAFVISLLIVIFGCFAVQVYMAAPDLSLVAGGFIPSPEIIQNPAMLYIAMGIIGATVMPHNLYLHSSIVQTRAYSPDSQSRSIAVRYSIIDSTIALMLALTINASILILAAATFHANGHTEIAELTDAHQLIAPILGAGIAATLFGIALLCCGLNSTVTATLSGQIVMEGFLRIKLAPWLRRLITRGIAIIPALTITYLYGQEGTAKLLILSQVILSLQLPFAVVPLILFTRNKKIMGEFKAPGWVIVLSATIAVILITLNMMMIANFLFATG